MIDLETLGRTPQSPIIAIGAVFFDPATGDMDLGKEWVVDFESACEKRAPESATVAWWMEQDDEARKGVLRGQATMSGALIGLRDYLNNVPYGPSDPKNLRVWGNGAVFDIAMLEDCYRQYDYDVPWSFWGVRDVRTIRDLAHPEIPTSDFPFHGVKHSALADAQHQANYVSVMWRRAREGFSS